MVTTVRALCRELQAGNERLELTTDLEVAKGEIPASLKGIIFRILQGTLKHVARTWTSGRIQVLLGHEGPDQLALELDVEHQTDTADSSPGAGPTGSVEEETIAAVWERAVLSGASLKIFKTGPGGCQCRAVWDL